jgi:signal peptidase
MHTRLVRLLELLAVGGVCALLVGAALGQPVLLGFVTSESMAPTLDTGDGYVAIPAFLAGPVEVGDVVTFRAEKLHGGGLTTHRVVAVTDDGYVTRGDGNPATDQDGNEPPVTDPQVVAHALQVGGHLVVLPGLGTAVTTVHDWVEAGQVRLASTLGTGAVLGPSGLAVVLTVLGLLAYAFETYRERSLGRRLRSRVRETGLDGRFVVRLLTVGLVVVATFGMVAPSGTQQIDMLSAQFEPNRPTTVAAGESKALTLTVPNSGIVPVVVFFEPRSDHLTVDQRYVAVPARGAVNASITLTAPSTPGIYREYLTRHRYFAVLPPAILSTLYEYHPWLPIAAVDATIALPFYLVARHVVGAGRIRNRSRASELALLTRLRRAVRGNR